jgi:hypothetical protein
VSTNKGRHNLKYGVNLKQTRLLGVPLRSLGCSLVG